MPTLDSPNLLIVPDHIVRDAVKRCNETRPEDWPEDDWITLSKSWDLNLFTVDDETGEVTHIASIYAVKDGHTQTASWCNVWRKSFTPVDSATSSYSRSVDSGCSNDTRFGG